VDFLETLEPCAIREAREEVGFKISLRSLLCVTNHCLPGENQHWVSPAYLGQILSGEAKNCEPAKTLVVRWFGLDQLPPNLTMTARNAINAFTRQLVSHSRPTMPAISDSATKIVKRPNHLIPFKF